MSPFRNAGWTYFEKMQDIMPNASARGGYAFSAMQTAPPPPFDQTVDLEGLDQGPSTADTRGEMSKDSITGQMDVDKEGDASMVVSASISKRKLAAAFLSDDELESTPDQSQYSPAESSRASASITSPEPAKKKSTKSVSSIASSSKSQTKSKASAQPSNASRGSLRQTSTKLSPALLIHEMQGSIGTLAAAVRESGGTDPVAKLRQQAVQLVSQRDDGLSAVEKITIIELFRKDYASLQTYLALLEYDELRVQWLQKQLE